MIMGTGIEEIYFEVSILISMLIALMSLALAKFNKRLE
jgi:putative ABC transporter, permease protein